jgi:hypothetical protein
LAALVGYGLLVALVLAGPAHGDPAWFIHLGSKTIPVQFARQELGRNVVVPHYDGHDGRFFWIQARDPFLLHPKLDAANLDRPAYRSQRIAYPLLASPWRVFGEYGLVWGLVITNLVIVAAGTAVAALLALDVSAPARAALAFALNPAVITGFVLDTGDVLAVAAVVAAIFLVRRGRLGAAIVAGVVAGLAKEPSLLALAAVALVVPKLGRRQRLAFIAWPSAFVAGWALYSRWRLGWPPSKIQEFTSPFYGYLDAYRRGWRPVGNWGDAIVAVALLALAVLIVVLWWRRRSLLLAASVPFAVLVPFFSSQVLDLADNSLRALGPALTLVAIDLYAGLGGRPAEPEGAPRASPP